MPARDSADPQAHAWEATDDAKAPDSGPEVHQGFGSYHYHKGFRKG